MYDDRVNMSQPNSAYGLHGLYGSSASQYVRDVYIGFITSRHVRDVCMSCTRLHGSPTSTDVPDICMKSPPRHTWVTFAWVVHVDMCAHCLHWLSTSRYASGAGRPSPYARGGDGEKNFSFRSLPLLLSLSLSPNGLLHHIPNPIPTSPPPLLPPKPKPLLRLRLRLSSHPPRASLSDPLVLQIAETLEDSTSHLPTSPPLQKLRDSSSQSLLSSSWPSRKDEPFRFTDTSFIKNSQIQPIPFKPPHFDLPIDTQFPNFGLLLVNGRIAGSASRMEGLPEGVFVGSVLDIPSEGILKRVSEVLGEFGGGDVFWSLNGIGAPDVVVVYVSEGCRVESPLHLRFLCGGSGGGGFGEGVMPVANPRVVVVVERGGEVGIVEEHCGGDGDGDECYWANSAVEILVCEGAKVTHCYVQRESANAAHIKWTVVQQESSSVYNLVEIGTGGKLSRHNLHVQQVGPDTATELSTFHLCLRDQTQDLHSRLVLDHPRGYSKQLHKCIVAHEAGQAVFDGNVRVNRFAQETDAGQLTRTLLLVPKATVNVKPNLQIVADNVKCSHGAAISNLEKDLLFYFQARGLDLETARRALVFSFGAEVIEKLPYSSLRKDVETHIKNLIRSFDSQRQKGAPVLE
ncbi:hypothetical protein Scep_022470 [Stephania cephalantha]|uniref:Fe-S cluster assembly protein SufD n=1 Tax=Stephania cephalantha TaxID=152367 RepID=A0AAP0F6F3_9MAGN